MNLLRRSNGLLFPYRGRARALFFSTAATTIPSPSATISAELNRRIVAAGDGNLSVAGVLNQWVGEGGGLSRNELQKLIRKLRRYNRYDHALQISQWMSDVKKGYALSPSDIAVQLELISRVYGVEEAEKYFDSLSDDSKGIEVYGALLHCYVDHKCLEKAEDTMDNMKVRGFLVNTLSYNVMLTLYANLGEYQKIRVLIQEMDKRGFSWNRVTYQILLNASVASSNIQQMEKLLAHMETDFRAEINWYAYVIAATGYLKAGLVEKAIKMLKKSENFIESSSARFAYARLLNLYGAVGKKDEVYRVWDLYKNLNWFFNLAYLSMISSLMKLDDIDGAERVWGEWLHRKRLDDTRIPNTMIIGYSKRGLWERAEALVSWIVASGMKLDANSWGHLATGYHIGGQMAKAAETMKKAISICEPEWKPNVYTLVACHQYLKGQGEEELAEELLKLVKERCNSSEAVFAKVEDYVDEDSLSSRALDQMLEDGNIVGAVPASSQLNDENGTES